MGYFEDLDKRLLEKKKGNRVKLKEPEDGDPCPDPSCSGKMYRRALYGSSAPVPVCFSCAKPFRGDRS